jgi:anti-sigma regulatory factor (Ser/Thr protein kinase)
VIAIPLTTRPTSRQCWNTISFASTLYLCPVLELLLTGVPSRWHPDLRLGLQEALINAAKHGNNLDPGKTVLVRYFIQNGNCWWVISDQGSEFTPPACLSYSASCLLPNVEAEGGRGLYILHQIFDQVQWNSESRELRLCKQVRSRSKQPLLC